MRVLSSLQPLNFTHVTNYSKNLQLAQVKQEGARYNNVVGQNEIHVKLNVLRFLILITHGS